MVGTCTESDGNNCWQKAFQECPNNIVVLETDSTNATFGFYCIPAETKGEFGLPDEPGSTDNNGWEGHCLGSDHIAQQCVGDLTRLCISIGGEPSTDGFSDPEGDGELTWTDVGCNDIPAPGYGDNSVPNTPNIPWVPFGFAAVILIVLVAIQKVRDSARKNTNPQTREHILLANQKDDGSTSIGDWDGDGDVDGRDFIQTSSNSSTKGSDGSGSGRDVIITREDKDKE